MPANTLHITNGDSVQLRETGLAGEVLTWRDALHEGPVPQGLSLDELRPIRAVFLAELSDIPQARVLAELAQRDQALARFAEFDEVILWFEHDLYDQLQLIQILDWIARQPQDGAEVSLICTSTYLGPLRPHELRELYPGRRPVSPEQLTLAAQAWAAFTAPDPRALGQLVREDTPALPYLRGALLRHLEQLPSAHNGLARTEQQILEIVNGAVARAADIFIADCAREESVFMGDVAFFSYLRRLAAGRVPLLEISGELKPFGRSTVAITHAGVEVLGGNADALRLNGIDRWLGGVHLHDGAVWRWNKIDQAAVASP